jgi:hypothetical protein
MDLLRGQGVRQFYLGGGQQFRVKAGGLGDFLALDVDAGQLYPPNRTQLIHGLADGEVEMPPIMGQLPLQQEGCHHREDVPPGAGLGMNQGGSDFQVAGFKAAKGAFHLGQVALRPQG